MAKSASGSLPRRRKKSTSAVRTVPFTWKDETRLYQLCRRMPEPEPLLRHLGVRLRKADVADVGNLQSVSTRLIRSSSSGKICHTQARFIAGDASKFLPNVHKRITGLWLSYVIGNDVSLLKAVMNSPSPRRVRMHGEIIFQEKTLESMCITELSLGKTEHLELCTPSAYPLHHILIAVRDLLRPGASMALVVVTPPQVSFLYAFLMTGAPLQDTTIANMLVGAFRLSSDLKESALKHVEYLAKGNPALRKLTTKAHHFVKSAQATAHTSLPESRLMEREDVALFTEVVERSHSVRSLTVIRFKCCEKFETAYLDELTSCPSQAPITLPRIRALGKLTVLSKLAIDVHRFKVNERCDIFCTVAASNTLQRVIVRNITVDKGLREMFSKIDIFYLPLKDHFHVGPLNIAALPECVLVTAVTLSYNHIERVDEFRSAHSVLMNYLHMTSLGGHTVTNMHDDNVH